MTRKPQTSTEGRWSADQGRFTPADEDWLGDLRSWVDLCRKGLDPSEAWSHLRG